MRASRSLPRQIYENSEIPNEKQGIFDILGSGIRDRFMTPFGPLYGPIFDPFLTPFLTSF